MGALTLKDSRRMPGPSIVWDQPCAWLDAAVDGLDQRAVQETWTAHARQLIPVRKVELSTLPDSRR